MSNKTIADKVGIYEATEIPKRSKPSIPPAEDPMVKVIGNELPVWPECVVCDLPANYIVSEDGLHVHLCEGHVSREQLEDPATEFIGVPVDGSKRSGLEVRCRREPREKVESGSVSGSTLEARHE